MSKYIDTLEIVVIGFMGWSFASKRYFGPMSEGVKKVRILKPSPRKSELQQQGEVRVKCMDKRWLTDLALER